MVPLSNTNNANHLVDSMQSLDLSSKPKESFDLRRVRLIQNVHQDDIHALIKLGDQTLVSGSKDGSLKKWSLEGKLIKNCLSPNEIDYKRWVTALAPLNDDQWMSGFRDGSAFLFDNSGEVKKRLVLHYYRPQDLSQHICKQRNFHRINCLSSFQDYFGRPSFFVGRPTQFTLHEKGRRDPSIFPRINCTITSPNDWVYAIHPISRSALLAITGCRLDLYAKDSHHIWHLNRKIIQEETSGGHHQRPFISSMTPLKHQNSHFGLAFFDGSVRVADIETNQIIFRKTEHRKRVWMIENVACHCFASCADDGLIKLWDLRKSGSIFTIRDNEEVPARVSVILKINDNELLSGTCPDDVWNSSNKAGFSFWDIRKI